MIEVLKLGAALFLGLTILPLVVSFVLALVFMGVGAVVEFFRGEQG